MFHSYMCCQNELRPGYKERREQMNWINADEGEALNPSIEHAVKTHTHLNVGFIDEILQDLQTW